MRINKYDQPSSIGYMLICLIGILLFPTGCIEPFNPQNVQDTTGILVVEGAILDKGTTIKLSRTINADNYYKVYHFSPDDVNNAIVQVIDDNRHVIVTAKPQIVDGTVTPEYVVSDEIIFNPGTKYALDIQIEGKHYQSGFVTPVLTPEIDEVSWRNNEGTSIDIMVSTHDPKNEVYYYRWLFEEDWEIIAQYFSELGFDPKTETFIEHDIFGPNNTYYCWSHDISKTVLLGTTVRFTEATIKNSLIHTFTSTDSRYSYLYSILVKQHGINKEAYIYYENLQKNIEQNGSIFAPQPTEMRGNIQCVSHPDEPVIGYIYAAKETVSRLYIDMSEMKRIYYYICGEPEIHGKEGFFYYYRYYNLGILYCDSRGLCYCLPRLCLDCTMQTHGGTKKKPDFWPNDHL